MLFTHLVIRTWEETATTWSQANCTAYESDLFPFLKADERLRNNKL